MDTQYEDLTVYQHSGREVAVGVWAAYYLNKKARVQYTSYYSTTINQAFVVRHTCDGCILINWMGARGMGEAETEKFEAHIRT